jgi:glycosyltransferase involved in cell wall biosynthesis
VKIALHAPLKSPDHPVASGDRALARAVVAALGRCGHDVRRASRVRSFDARGDDARQARLATVGAALAARYVARVRHDAWRPDLWFTYHLWHKAPDLLGPAVSRTLDLPYVVAEASIAPAAAQGRWSRGYAAALRAIDAADAIVSVNPRDVERIRDARGLRTHDGLMPPFLDVDAFLRDAPARQPADRRERRVTIACVAMMRDGAKLASYRLLADALRGIADADWTLAIAGDGPARADVEAAFAGFDPGRVRLLGALDARGVAALLRAVDVFAWPAIDEAFGMALLEAQACGLPVVAGRSAGVAAVVDDGASGILVAPGDAAAFGAALATVVTDGGLREAMGQRAAAYVRERHGLASAASLLDALLRGVVAERASARRRAARR